MKAVIFFVALTGIALSVVSRIPIARIPSSLEKYLSEYRGRSSTHAERVRLRACGRCLKKGEVFPEEISNHYDTFYLGNLTIGSPEQNFTVLFDTGSGLTWVVSADCTSIACTGTQRRRNKFEKVASSTFRKEWTPFNTTYGSGSVRGFNGKDTIRLAGVELTEQSFGMATFLSQSMDKMPYDGIFGLAWPDLENGTGVIHNLLPHLDQPIFSVWLSKNQVPQDTPHGGLITFGGIDTDHCAEEIVYVPLSKRRFWEFNISSFTVGGYTSTIPTLGISDTGTSGLHLPKAVVDEVVRVTGAKFDDDSKSYMVLCDGKYPDIDIAIAGGTFTVPASQFVLNYTRGEECALAVTEAKTAAISYALLGDPFIRAYCNIHDFGNGRIGFAKAKNL